MDEFADQYFISSKNLFLKNLELLHLPHCNYCHMCNFLGIFLTTFHQLKKLRAETSLAEGIRSWALRNNFDLG